MKTVPFESQVYIRRANIQLSYDVVKAQEAVGRDPRNVGAWDALGREYIRHHLYREAIEVYSTGLTFDPLCASLYMHRGQAYLNIMRYEESIADSEMAVRLDPFTYDGWYHLIVANYLSGNDERCVQVFNDGKDYVEVINDVICSTYWVWMALMRLGRKEEAMALDAGISSELKLIKNNAFYLVILMRKGLIKPEELLKTKDENPRANPFIIMRYGIANYCCNTGRFSEYRDILRQIIEPPEEERWPCFGYQAALLESRQIVTGGGKSI